MSLENVSHATLWESTWERVVVGMAIVCARGRFVKVNPAFTEMFGYSDEELLEKEARQVVFEDDQQHIRECIEDVRNGERDSFHHLTRWTRRSGQMFFARLVADGIKWQTDNVAMLWQVLPTEHDREATRQQLDAHSMLIKVLQDELTQARGDIRAIMGRSDRIHVGHNQTAGGDFVGRDYNSTGMVRWLGPLITAVIFLLAYITYLVYWKDHGGRAEPPRVPSVMERIGE